MDDTTRLELTKIKLLVLRRKNKSLLEIAAKNIIDNLSIHLENGQLEKLPFCMREAVLQEFLSRRSAVPNQILCATEFGKKLNEFSTLLHPQTKRIDLNGLMSFCHSFCMREMWIKVVQIIAARAPNVQSLSFGSKGSMIYEHRLVAAICSLKELKKLDISQFSLESQSLTIICDKLKKLEQIQLRSFEDWDHFMEDNEIIDFKRCFERLKVLQFGWQPDLLTNVFRRMCIQHLPRLQFIDYFGSTLSNHPQANILGYGLPSEASSLRHLHTDPTPLPLVEAFPHLTHLTVQWFRGRQYQLNEIDALLHFTKIEALILDDIPSAEIVDLFLNKYGKDLLELKIFSLFLELQFKEIFKSCPKLEKLTVQGALMVDDSESIQFYAKLREFEYFPLNGMPANGTLTLSNILSAPLLESVVIFLNIYRHNVDQTDLVRVSSLISDKSILSRVKTLNFHIGEVHMTDPQVGCTLFKALSEITKNACAFLPNCSSSLVHFKFVSTCPSDTLRRFYLKEHAFDAIHEESFYRSLGDENYAKFAYACVMGET
ncbi:uncharacterized protein LOC135947696 [Cloeon dipterum]|uniref:uncharacterized protein LOC135947696 n=1 Tax=Cloeon dipterum TaxID=197152 RepID=UPI00321FD5FF